MQVAPQVYFYPFTSLGENNCNTIVLDGPEKTLIDPGHKHLWPDLVRRLEEDGLSPRDITLVLHTHCHPDHMEAGEFLEFEYGATQAMSGPEADFLAGPGREFFPWMGLDYPQGSIGRLLSPGPLDLGDKVVELISAPGHTPGSLCLHWPEAKVLITGDVIFARSVGRTDFPGGDHQTLGASIRRLAELDQVEILLPGHGPAVVGRNQVAANFKTAELYFGG